MNTPQERPPIVAVLGHVDHGKSTLLDFIRKSNIVATEAGGITQHVAAYEVKHDHEGKKKRITFIDTPGHAAFQAMRARGAKVADIAILVVAADDGVKAQTLEALQSIRDAHIPFVVAINKIDKPNADLSRTQSSLLEHGVYLETLGGDVPWAAISAKTGAGVDVLLDLILIVAEFQDLKAVVDAPATGFVIEAHRDQKRGIAATLIITAGTLKKGMAVLAGHAVAPVRLMEDHARADLHEASFSTPVVLIGFDELPEAGAEFRAYSNKKQAEAARPELPASAKTIRATSDEHFMLPIIIRTDTAGSLEAIQHELPALGDEFRSVSLVQTGIGDISETDIKAAIAADLHIVFGFNVGIDREALALARQNAIEFETFAIIYKLTERLAELLSAAAPTRIESVVVGRAKLLKIFSSKHDEHLVGGKVLSGAISTRSKIVIKRRTEAVGRGDILSIQSGRNAVDKVEEGSEFGAQIVADEKPQEGDVVEAVETKEI